MTFVALVPAGGGPMYPLAMKPRRVPWCTILPRPGGGRSATARVRVSVKLRFRVAEAG
jgi:hypothetical protein